MSGSAEELIKKAQAGDGQAMEVLLEENAGLIWSMVRCFIGRGVETEDLYQLGCVGFIKAVKGYDSSFGTRFSTYAVPKISGEIRRFLRDNGTIKVSRSLKERSVTVYAARKKLEQQLGREPAVSELAAFLQITPEEIAQCENASAPVDSLQKQLSEDFTLEDVLSDSESEDRIIERVSLKDAIKALPERERKVLLLRYFRDMTQERAAGLLGISQVQVSRIEKHAVEMLREKMK